MDNIFGVLDKNICVFMWKVNHRGKNLLMLFCPSARVPLRGHKPAASAILLEIA
jgi:hypothetical protein